MDPALKSFSLIALAEMGDKTQLLAMAFVVRYSPFKVLLGVLLATLLNHALAVAAGFLLSSVIPFAAVALLAALSFIGFGLWTLQGDTLNEPNPKTRYGAILTVAIAFFFAEMGDKTQLATISLAAKYPNPFLILMGTTLGMITADGLGIAVGSSLKQWLPEQKIRWLAAFIFIVFGFYGVFQTLKNKLPLWGLALLLTGMLIGVAALAKQIRCRQKN